MPTAGTQALRGRRERKQSPESRRGRTRTGGRAAGRAREGVGTKSDPAGAPCGCNAWDPAVSAQEPGLHPWSGNFEEILRAELRASAANN